MIGSALEDNEDLEARLAEWGLSPQDMAQLKLDQQISQSFVSDGLEQRPQQNGSPQEAAAKLAEINAKIRAKVGPHHARDTISYSDPILNDKKEVTSTLLPEDREKSPFFDLKRAEELGLPPESYKILETAAAAEAAAEAEGETGANKAKDGGVPGRGEPAYDRLNESYSGESQEAAEDAHSRDDVPAGDDWKPSKDFLEKLGPFQEEFWEDIASALQGGARHHLERDFALYRGWDKYREEVSREMAEWFHQAEPTVDTDGRRWLDPEGYKRYRTIEAEIKEDKYGSWLVLDKGLEEKANEKKEEEKADGQADKDADKGKDKDKDRDKDKEDAGEAAGEEEDDDAKFGKNFMKIYNFIQELSGGAQPEDPDKKSEQGARKAKGVTLEGLKKWKLAFHEVADYKEDKSILDRKAYKDQFWRRVRRWAEKEVAYDRLELPWYDLTEDDLAAFQAPRGPLPEGWQFEPGETTPWDGTKDGEAMRQQQLYNFQQSKDTGERYLRVVVKQAFRKVKPEEDKVHDEKEHCWPYHDVEDLVFSDVIDEVTGKPKQPCACCYASVTDKEEEAFAPLLRKWQQKFGLLPKEAREPMDERGTDLEYSAKGKAKRDEVRAEEAAEVTKMFQEADQDGDGLLSYEEYVAFDKARYDIEYERCGGNKKQAIKNNGVTLKEWYAALNGMTPGTQGVSEQDMVRSRTVLWSLRKRRHIHEKKWEIRKAEEKTYANERVEAHILRFYRYDYHQRVFRQEYQSLYDVTNETTAQSSGAWTNDILVTRNQHTYYFRKDYQARRFQLYRHSMGNPPTVKGGHHEDRVDPSADTIVPNYFIDVKYLLIDHPGGLTNGHPKEGKQKGPKAGKPLGMEDLGIIFLTPAARSYCPHKAAQLEENDFLNTQFACVYRKCYEVLGAQKASFLSIFHLYEAKKNENASGEGAGPRELVTLEPIIHVPKDSIPEFMAGFVMGQTPHDGAKPEDGAKARFVIMGRSQMYAIEHEFRDEVIGTGTTPLADKDVPLKPSKSPEFQKWHYHRYKIHHRDLVMPYTHEPLTYTYMQACAHREHNLLWPFRTRKRGERLGGRVDHQQEEMRYARDLFMNQDIYDREPSVYEDSYYACNDRQWRQFLFHADDRSEYADRDWRDCYFSDRDFILVVNKNTTTVQYWSLKRGHGHGDLEGAKAKLAQRDNQKLQRQILEQFDRTNQTAYQDNLPRDKDHTRILTNKYVKPLYLHSSLKGIVSSHNSVTIDDEEFRLHEKYLLLDLGKDDGRLSMINLYHSPQGHAVQQGHKPAESPAKLVKYQLSYLHQKAVFFFLQRDRKKTSQKVDTAVLDSGAYFFLVTTMEELGKLDGKTENALLTSQSRVTIMLGVDRFESITYSPEQVRLRQDNLARHVCTNVEIRFDLVQDNYRLDTEAPDFIVPFFIASARSKRETDNDSRPDVRFKTYIAFLNIADAPCGDRSSDKDAAAGGKDDKAAKGPGSDVNKHDPRCEKYPVDFHHHHGRCLDAHGHQNVKFPGGLINAQHNVEEYPVKFKKGYLELHQIRQYKYLHQNERNRNSFCDYEHNRMRTCCQLFTRTSNWQKNIKKFYSERSGQDLQLKPPGDTFSAKFQFGLYHNTKELDMQILELQEILVTIDMADAAEDRLGVEYVSLRHCFPSRALKAAPAQGHAMNHYLVPKIDDNGLVTGSYLMLNLRTYRMPPVKLKDYRLGGGGYREALEEFQHEELLRWQPKFYGRAGQWAEVAAIHEGSRLDLLFHDGRVLPFGFGAVDHSPKEAPGDKPDDSADPSLATSDILKAPYSFDYGIVELNDDSASYDKSVRLETPFAQLGYKKAVFANRLGEYYTVTSSCLLKGVIEQHVFDPNMQIMELYKAQTQNMCMAHENFFEAFRTCGRDDFNRFKSYFQPKLLLGGRSFCSLEFPGFAKRVRPLQTALGLKGEQAPLDAVLANSPIETVADQWHVDEHPRTLQIAQAVFDMFGMNRHFDFTYDMNQRSLVHVGLENTWSRPVSEIITNILQWNDARYQEALIYDLPELLCQDKIKMDDFLTKDQAEELAEDQDDENRLEPCNIESPLRDANLPFLGSPVIGYFDQIMHDSVYEMREELEAKIIREEDQKQDIKEDKKRPPTVWTSIYSSLTTEDIENKEVEVEYHFFNFWPVVRKIKIGLYLGLGYQPPGAIIGQEDALRYMSMVRQNRRRHPADFCQISDLLLADLVYAQYDAKEFFECTAVGKLIDRQYIKTRKLYGSLLIGYCLLYAFPLCLGIFWNHQNIRDTIAEGNPWTEQQIEDGRWGRFYITCVAALASLFFWSLEFIEISNAGWSWQKFRKEYLQSYNLSDITEPFVYALHAAIYFCFDFDKHDRAMELVYTFVTVLCFAQAIIKCLQYVRFLDSFSFLVAMFVGVFSDLGPFMILFFFFVAFFALIQLVLSSHVSTCDYPDFPDFVMILFHTFRTSVGDVDVPEIDDRWNQEDGSPVWQAVAIYSTWLAWMLNLGITLIILLNFLIAEVSQTYDRIKGLGKQFLYRNRSQVNQHTFIYLDAARAWKLNLDSEFRVLVFRSPKDLADSNADEFFGYTNTISKDVRLLLNVQKADLLRQIKRSETLLGGNKRQQEQLLTQKVAEITQRSKRTEEGVRTSFGEGMKSLKGLLRDAKAGFDRMGGSIQALKDSPLDAGGIAAWAEQQLPKDAVVDQEEPPQEEDKE